MVSLVPGLGSRKFATQVVYLSLASLGLVAANSRLHASLTFYVPNPNLVRFSKIFFPKIFQYFFRKFLPKFFPKLRHTASTMVSLVPGLGSRKFGTQVVYLSLASLGLVSRAGRPPPPPPYAGRAAAPRAFSRAGRPPPPPPSPDAPRAFQEPDAPPPPPPAGRAAAPRAFQEPDAFPPPPPPPR